MGLSSIVVGIDGSESSLRALAFATGLAAREGSQIFACFVSRRVTSLITLGLNGALVVDWGPHADRIGATVDAELRRSSISGTFCHREGDVVLELRRLARDNAADLIVVGRSSGRLRNLRSVSRRLLSCGQPVLVLP